MSASTEASVALQGRPAGPCWPGWRGEARPGPTSDAGLAQTGQVPASLWLMREVRPLCGTARSRHLINAGCSCSDSLPSSGG